MTSNLGAADQRPATVGLAQRSVAPVGVLATADPFHGAATEPGVTPSVPEPSLGHRPAQIPTQVEMASAGGAEHLVTLLSRAAEEFSEVSLWAPLRPCQG